MRARVDRRAKRSLLTPRWLAVHVGVLVLVAGFLGLGWWQINRAKGGNLLSFGYAVEWPVFAAFVVWVWVVEMRKALATTDDPSPVEAAQAEGVRSDQPAPQRRRRSRNEAAYDDSDDPALRAYNHYLAWLGANPNRTPADYPGLPDPAPATKESS